MSTLTFNSSSFAVDMLDDAWGIAPLKDITAQFLAGHYIVTSGTATSGTVQTTDGPPTGFFTVSGHFSDSSLDALLNSVITQVTVSTDSELLFSWTQINLSVRQFVQIGLNHGLLSGADIINGTQFGDVLWSFGGNDIVYAGAGNDYLLGDAGNDQLDGQLGTDVMAGGVGDDTYFVDSTGDLVEEFAGQGSDSVNASVSHTLEPNVERLVLIGSDNIDGTGNALNNVISGNGGNNVLDGGAGNDTLSGGAGDDVYLVDSALDKVTEAPGGGTDTVHSMVSWTLGLNLENLILDGNADIDGTGNTLNNHLTGNDATTGSMELLAPTSWPAGWATTPT